MAVETTYWNATDYLGSGSAILAYLEAVLEDGDPALIAAALADVARIRGIAEPSKLRPNIALDSVIRKLKTVGLQLTEQTA